MVCVYIQTVPDGPIYRLSVTRLFASLAIRRASLVTVIVVAAGLRIGESIPDGLKVGAPAEEEDVARMSGTPTLNMTSDIVMGR